MAESLGFDGGGDAGKEAGLLAARRQFWGCISALLTAVIWIYAVGMKSYEGFGFDWGTWRKKMFEIL